MQLKTRPQNAKEYCATMISDYLTKERVILFLLDLFTTAQIKLFVVADGAKPNMKSCKTTEAQWDEAERKESQLLQRLQETVESCCQQFYNQNQSGVAPINALHLIESLREEIQ